MKPLGEEEQEEWAKRSDAMFMAQGIKPNARSRRNMAEALWRKSLEGGKP